MTTATERFRDLLYQCAAFVAEPVPNEGVLCTFYLPLDCKIEDREVRVALERKIRANLVPASDRAPNTLLCAESWKNGFRRVGFLAHEEPKRVAAALLPMKHRAEGFDMYTYVTDFTFVPVAPDYISIREHSWHVQYNTRRKQSGVMAGLKRYLDSKSKYLETSATRLVGSKVMAECARPLDPAAVHGPDGDDSDQSDTESPNDPDPPFTGLAVDGLNAGWRIAMHVMPLLLQQGNSTASPPPAPVLVPSASK